MADELTISKSKVYGRIILIRPNGKHTEFPLTKQTCIFGRLPYSDVRIFDNAVSKLHAELLIDPSNTTEATLAVHSINGIILNSQEIVNRGCNAALKSGSTFEIAGRCFKYEAAKDVETYTVVQSPQKRSNAKLRFSLINAAQVDTPTKKAPQLRRKSSIIASITSPFESLFNTFQAPAQPDQLGTNIDTDLMTWSDDEDSEQSDGRDVVQFDEYQHQSDSSDSDSDEEAVNTKILSRRRASLRMTITASPVKLTPKNKQHQRKDETSDEEIESLLISPSVVAQIPLPDSPTNDLEADCDNEATANCGTPSYVITTAVRPTSQNFSPSAPVRFATPLNRKHSLRERVLIKSAVKAHHDRSSSAFNGIKNVKMTRSLSLGSIPNSTEPLQTSPTKSSKHSVAEQRNVVFGMQGKAFGPDGLEDSSESASSSDTESDSDDDLPLAQVSSPKRPTLLNSHSAPDLKLTGADISEFFVASGSSSDSDSDDEGHDHLTGQYIDSLVPTFRDGETQEITTEKVTLESLTPSEDNPFEVKSTLIAYKWPEPAPVTPFPTIPDAGDEQHLSPRASRAARRSSGAYSASPKTKERRRSSQIQDVVPDLIKLRQELAQENINDHEVSLLEHVNSCEQVDVAEISTKNPGQDSETPNRSKLSPRKSALKSRPSFGISEALPEIPLTPTLGKRKVFFSEEPEYKVIANRLDPAFLAEQESMRISPKRQRHSPRLSAEAEHASQPLLNTSLQPAISVPMSKGSDSISKECLSDALDKATKLSPDRQTPPHASIPNTINTEGSTPVPSSSTPSRARRVITATPSAAVMKAFEDMQVTDILTRSLPPPRRVISPAKRAPNIHTGQEIELDLAQLLASPVPRLRSTTLQSVPMSAPTLYPTTRVELLRQHLEEVKKLSSPIKLGPAHFGLPTTPAAASHPVLVVRTPTDQKCVPPSSTTFTPFLSNVKHLMAMPPSLPKTPKAIDSLRHLFKQPMPARDSTSDWADRLEEGDLESLRSPEKISTHGTEEVASIESSEGSEKSTALPIAKVPAKQLSAIPSLRARRADDDSSRAVAASTTSSAPKRATRTVRTIHVDEEPVSGAQASQASRSTSVRKTPTPPSAPSKVPLAPQRRRLNSPSPDSEVLEHAKPKAASTGRMTRSCTSSSNQLHSAPVGKAKTLDALAAAPRRKAIARKVDTKENESSQPKARRGLRSQS